MRKTYYEQLKTIHPDLRNIEFDGIEVSLIFSSKEYMVKEYMVKREFASNSETYRLVNEIEHLLLSI